ncbi:MAG: CDP-alcohol phosphatidyltransferase family protein [Trueperaceae bacterium]|nr:CDP-alcohol phosphatidyltransferase family protein [Trueperaceae bacterium]
MNADNVALNNVAKLRPRSEVVMVVVAPLARQLVRLGARWRLNPLHLVLSHGALGLVAALLIGFGTALWVAAVLLLLKTLIDNVDGGLARATGQVTEMGRYLDTEVDFVVNIALFAALSAYGPGWLALLAFVLLTLLLTFDFNAEYLYRLRRDGVVAAGSPPPGAPRRWLEAARRIYRVLFEPQDRFARWLDRRFFETLYTGALKTAPRPLRLAWNDLFSTATLVNLGLSTQLVVFAACLAIGRPFVYVYLVLMMSVYVVIIQLWRARRFRRRLADWREEQHA